MNNKIHPFLFFSLLGICLLFMASAHAQPIADLAPALESGKISFSRLSGTGSSSGLSIRGTIRNDASSPVRINTNLARPLFLKNSSDRQNMVAYQILETGGRYFRDAMGSFIEIKPNSTLGVELVAYCADYEKENPVGTDSFSLEMMPSNLQEVTEKIRKFKMRNPSEDVTAAAQVALWLGQGKTPDEIGKTFEYTASDLATARRILAE